MNIELFFKNKKAVLLVLVFAGFIAGISAYYIWQFLASKETQPPAAREETLAERQTREINELRSKVSPQLILTEEEASQQFKELNESRGEIKPLSEEQAQKQFEALNKSRKEIKPLSGEEAQQQFRELLNQLIQGQ